MNPPSTETASSCTCVSSTTVSSRPTAKARRSSGEPTTIPGTNGAITPGSGRVPITLSTAILRGSGASSASGLARRLSRNSAAMSAQHGRDWRSSRRMTWTSVCVAIVLCLSGGGRLESAGDHRGRAGAIERYREEAEDGQRAEDGGDDPGLRHGRRAGKSRDGRRDRDARGRESWPAAKPHELRAAPMIFDGDEQTGRSEESAANFQVPALVIAAASDGSAEGLERSLDGAQSRVEIQPTFPPQRPSPGKRWREPGHTAVPPRGKASLEPSHK